MWRGAGRSSRPHYASCALERELQCCVHRTDCSGRRSGDTGRYPAGYLLHGANTGATRAGAVGGRESGRKREILYTTLPRLTAASSGDGDGANGGQSRRPSKRGNETRAGGCGRGCQRATATGGQAHAAPTVRVANAKRRSEQRALVAGAGARGVCAGLGGVGNSECTAAAALRASARGSGTLDSRDSGVSPTNCEAPRTVNRTLGCSIVSIFDCRKRHNERKFEAVSFG